MKTKVAIVGGGPAGSACAIHLAKLGISSAIIERDSFPRFHIGESLTEQSGSCLRELGFAEEELAKLFPVKYGVNIYGPSGRNPFWVPVMRRDAAGELKDTFTWQVRRSTFDRMLLDRALNHGAELVPARAKHVLQTDGWIKGITVANESGERDIQCDVVVDASGQSTFLSRLGLASPRSNGRYCRQMAVYSHFRHAERDPGREGGNTLVFFQRKYYWAWFIPIDATVTSIGFVLPNEYFRSRNETTQEFLSRELKEFNPELARRVKEVEYADEVRATSNYSYEIDNYTGKGWLCIGDAHQFIDPLFSMGVGIALSEGRNSARAIHAFLEGRCADPQHPFREFEEHSRKAIAACQTVLDGFWEHTLSFGLLLTRYREDIIDLLAGHVWDGRNYDALKVMEQKVAAQRKATMEQSA